MKIEITNVETVHEHEGGSLEVVLCVKFALNTGESYDLSACMLKEAEGDAFTAAEVLPHPDDWGGRSWNEVESLNLPLNIHVRKQEGGKNSDHTGYDPLAIKLYYNLAGDEFEKAKEIKGGEIGAGILLRRNLRLRLNGHDIDFVVTVKWYPELRRAVESPEGRVHRRHAFEPIERTGGYEHKRLLISLFLLSIALTALWNQFMNDDVYRPFGLGKWVESFVDVMVIFMATYFGVRASNILRSPGAFKSFWKYPEFHVAPDTSLLMEGKYSRRSVVGLFSVVVFFLFLLSPASLPHDDLSPTEYFVFGDDSSAVIDNGSVWWPVKTQVFIYRDNGEGKKRVGRVGWLELSKTATGEGGHGEEPAQFPTPVVPSPAPALSESRASPQSASSRRRPPSVTGTFASIGEDVLAVYSRDGVLSDSLRQEGFAEEDVRRRVLVTLADSQGVLSARIADVVVPALRAEGWNSTHIESLSAETIASFERDGDNPSWERPFSMTRLLALAKAIGSEGRMPEGLPVRFLAWYTSWRSEPAQDNLLAGPDNRVARRTATEVLAYLERCCTRPSPHSEDASLLRWHDAAVGAIEAPDGRERTAGAEGLLDYLDQCLRHGLLSKGSTSEEVARTRLAYFTSDEATRVYNQQPNQFRKHIAPHLPALGTDTLSRPPTRYEASDYERLLRFAAGR